MMSKKALKWFVFQGSNSVKNLGVLAPAFYGRAGEWIAQIKLRFMDCEGYKFGVINGFITIKKPK